MKKLLVVLFVLPLFIACTSEKATYGKAIADFVQTDKSGAKYDMKFKIEKINEIRKITVADSVAYLTNKMETERAEKIRVQEEAIRNSEAAIEKEKKSGLTMKMIIDMYTENINKAKSRIEEYKTWNPGWTDNYKGRNSDEIIAIAVNCTYSAIPPILNTKMEDTDYFILSPDGKTCYKQTKKLEL